MKASVVSTAALIRERIEGFPAGEPFTSVEFMTSGTRVSVDHALSRLTKAGVISRVTRGVYVRPIINKHVGPVVPGPFKIAQAVARSMGAQISVNGAEAARRFELSTQMSAQSLFLTTGPTRHIKVGNSRIRLQHTSPRKLALAGRPAGAALSALWYLGRGEVTSKVIAQIRTKLSPEEFQALRSSTELMPSWMSDAFYRYSQETSSELSVA